MVYRVRLFVNYTSFSGTNSIDLVALDKDSSITLTQAYANAMRGLLRTNEEIVRARAYEMAYDNTENKWEQLLPQWEITLGLAGLTAPPVNALPLGMGLYIATDDASPFRSGRLLVKTRLGEPEVGASLDRFTLTSGTDIADNVDGALLAMQLLCIETNDAYPVNLHKNRDTPDIITAHRLGYVDKYKYFG